MPTYEYRCKQCDSVFSAMQSIWPKKRTKCPCCGSEETEKIVSRSNIGKQGPGGPSGPFC